VLEYLISQEPCAWRLGALISEFVIPLRHVREEPEMKPSIEFQKIWHDDDVVELAISVADGVSLFQCRTYVAHQKLTDAVEQLDVFKNHVHGGLCDLRFGEFGPEYAGGAFHARFEYYRPERGRLSITVKAESDWHEFTHTKVASNATLFLKTEPALFDSWLTALKALANGNRLDAVLECTE
jgi:hypothetical protein